MRSMLLLALGLGGPVVLGACGASDTDGADAQESSGAESSAAACAIETERVPMPAGIRESSGLARAADGVLWTHNDGNEARLYRVTEGGAVEQVVALEGATASDIEDIDAAPCPGGTGDCLYLADTGDNAGARPEVSILVVAAPAPGVARATALRLAFRYPGGPRDAEALAVLPNGDALVLTKGRGTPIELYRVRPGGGQGAAAALEPIARLAPTPERASGRVTGAGASEDGRWIAIRSNRLLSIHRSDALLAGDARPALEFDLTPLGEAQGEGVDMASDGRVWLTSEGGGGASSTLARLRCSLPG